MSSDVSLVLALRRALARAKGGGGLARALVTELRGEGGAGRDAARRVLLGSPLGAALAPLQAGADEVAMLASLVAVASESSSLAVGRSGGSLSITLERWLKAKEGAKMEDRVMRFRGLVASLVLGAVTAMMAELGPLVGSLSFSAPQAPSGGEGLVLAAAAMAAVASGMLGVYMSGRGFGANVAVRAVARATTSPIASSGR